MEKKFIRKCPLCGGRLEFLRSRFVDNVDYPNEPKLLLEVTYNCANNDVVSKNLVTGKSCSLLEQKFFDSCGNELKF